MRDLESEHVAGDIADEDRDRLRRDYISRTSVLLAKIEVLERPIEDAQAAPVPHMQLRRALGRSKTRRILIALIAVWVLAAVGLVALHFAGVRLPGQSATGSISLSEALVVQQELTQAIVVYGEVLAKVPNQHEALTYQGWLIRLSGVAAHGRSVVSRGDLELARAASVAPGYPDARGLYGIALFEDLHQTRAALNQFSAMLRDHPAATLIAALRPRVLPVYTSAKVAVPAQFTKSPAS